MKKSILITGCSSGIGLHCALALQKRGYRVFATARKENDVDELKKLGLSDALALDVTNSESIHHALTQIKSKTDTLDFLFNNAGYTQPGAVEDLTKEAMYAQFEANVFGPMELTNQVIKMMRAQKQGRIIQNGSLLGYVTMPFRGAYNSSKFALEGLTDTLRQELRDTNIFISIIEPGPIYSKIREKAKANFFQYIDFENSVHRETYQSMLDRYFQIHARTPFYLTPDAVLKKLIHAIESKKPKARYHVGFVSLAFYFARLMIPTRLLDAILIHLSR